MWPLKIATSKCRRRLWFPQLPLSRRLNKTSAQDGTPFFLDTREEILSMTIPRPARLLPCICALILLIALSAPLTAQAQTPVRYDSGTISGLTARNIGSATMGGRISTVDAVDESGK